MHHVRFLAVGLMVTSLIGQDCLAADARSTPRAVSTDTAPAHQTKSKRRPQLPAFRLGGPLVIGGDRLSLSRASNSDPQPQFSIPNAARTATQRVRQSATNQPASRRTVRKPILEFVPATAPSGAAIETSAEADFGKGVRVPAAEPGLAGAMFGLDGAGSTLSTPSTIDRRQRAVFESILDTDIGSTPMRLGEISEGIANPQTTFGVAR